MDNREPNLFPWAPKSLQMVTAAMKLKDTCSLDENLDQPRQHIKKQRHYLPTKVCLVKAMLHILQSLTILGISSDRIKTERG